MQHRDFIEHNQKSTASAAVELNSFGYQRPGTWR